MEPKLIEVTDGVSLFGTSAVDLRFIYREIFEWGSYRDVRLPDRPYVVDAGANVGLFALWVKQTRPDAEILAFEPVAELVAAARRNMELFHFTDVTVHQVALGSVDRDAVRFRHYPLRPSGSSLHLKDQTRLKDLSSGWVSARLNERMYQGREIDVTVAPLARYLPAGRRVDLLKVDVVGAELDVFAGLDDDQWPQIRQVIVDAQNVGDRVARVRDTLAAHGLTTSVLQNTRAVGDETNYLVHATR